MTPSSCDLILQIREALPSYTRAFKQLGSYILAQTFAASSMSIEELAQEANVSVATVNRFAHECGFDGYAQFRAALRGLFDRIFEPVEKAQASQIESRDVISQSLDNAIESIQRTKEMLNEATLNHAVDLILSADNILVTGMGVSALHSSFLVDAIEPLLSKNRIKELASFGGAERAFRQAAMITDKDLLIAISLPRYSQGVIDLATLARKQGCKVLSLTDLPSSPLMPLSDEILLAVSDHPVLYATHTALIALIEVLVMAVVRRIDGFAERIKQQTQNVLPYLYYPRHKL